MVESEGGLSVYMLSKEIVLTFLLVNLCFRVQRILGVWKGEWELGVLEQTRLLEMNRLEAGEDVLCVGEIQKMI